MIVLCEVRAIGRPGWRVGEKSAAPQLTLDAIYNTRIRMSTNMLSDVKNIFHVGEIFGKWECRTLNVRFGIRG